MYTSVSDDYSLPATENSAGCFDPTRRADASSDDDQLACCWSANKPALVDMFMAGLFGLSGIGAMVLGVIIAMRADGTGVTGGAITVVLGSLLLVAGLLCLLYKVLRPQQAIVIYSDGVEIVGKSGSQKYLWKDIHKILTLEFTAHIAARMSYVVWIEPVKGDTIRFDTNYEGEAEEVLAYLTSHCDYIVRNPNGYTKRTN